jgi:hypothetical protein
MQASDTNRARDALCSIPPDLDRTAWVKAGMGFHAAGGDFDTFDQWSAPAGNYNARACWATWNSFKTAPGGVGDGSLFGMAKDHGWKENSASHRPAPRPTPAPRKAAAPERKPAPGMSPAEVWSRCQPAVAAHPYIQAKDAVGVPLDTLRVLPADDRLRIMGEPMAGSLVLPAYSADRLLQSLQFVTTGEVAARLGKASKPNLPGSPMAGAMHVVGDLKTSHTVFVVEGIGQAWAVWQSTGCAAVACFGAGNMARVAAGLRERNAAAKLVLVGDRGKEELVQGIAADVGGQFVWMPEGEADNFDANNLAQRDGADALADLLERAKVPAKPVPRYKLLGADDLRNLPSLAWRVRGVLPAVGLAALFGPSASGKSFLAFDMAAAIAEGQRWFDCRVNAAPVVYAALEGEAGFKLRAQAWETSRGRRLPDGLRMMLQPFKLIEPQDVADLAAVVPAGAVVVLDTLNRAAPTADENSSRDMGEILEATKNLQAATGGLVLLVHHTGKNAAAGLRGHSSLFAAMDAAIEVSRDGDRREWRVSKSKDGQDGDAHPFKLSVEMLGHDQDGDAVTSCVVTAGEPDSPKSRRDLLPRAAKVAFDALVLALVTDGAPAPQSIKDRVGLMAPLKVAPEEAWRAGCYQAGIAESDAEADSKRRAFSRARNQLLDLEVVATFEGFVWVK